MNRTAQTMLLRDGRTLGYAEWGDPDGIPVFYFTSPEASRYSRHPDETILTDLGVHLFTFDRSGRGLSSPHKGSTLLDWADDVRNFVQHRNITRFAMMGHSQGGIHCLACAYKYPDMVSSATLVSAVAGLDDPAVLAMQPRFLKIQYWMSQHAPWLMTLQWNIFRLSIQGERGQKMIERQMLSLPRSDQEVFRIEGGADTNMKSIREALRQGGAGVTRDFCVVAGDWGFTLEDIRTKVFIWHGELDSMIAPSTSRYLAARLPNSETTLIPDGGSLLFYGRWRDILQQLINYWSE